MFAGYWMFLLFVPFLIPEVLKAVDKKPGGTFSEWIWAVFAIDLVSRRFGFLRRATLGAFLAGLGFHLLARTSVIPVIVFGAACAWWMYYWWVKERVAPVQEDDQSPFVSEEGNLMMREEWDAVFDRGMEILARTHPQKGLEWRRDKAYARTVAATRMDRPSTLTGAVIGAAFRVKVKGERMDWKWSKAAWKGVRAGLAGAAAIAVVAGGEALLTVVDTEAELLQMGAPVVLVPVLLSVGAVARNWLKQRKKAKGEQFVTLPRP